MSVNGHHLNGMNGHSNGYSNGVNGHSNGVNGHSNGVNGTNGSVSGASSTGMIEWSVGFVNGSGKYLTAESFGFKVNVTGNSLKKRQVWLLEQDGQSPDVVFLRSYQGRYISADKHGNVRCEAEERGAAERFLVQVSADGRWSFKSDVFGYYLGGRGDDLTCSAKTSEEQCLWFVHLAVHPQLHLRSVNRKRYARLREAEVQVTDNMPWGQAALITVQYHHGQYAIRCCDGRFLTREGGVTAQLDEQSLYKLEFHQGYMAFKDQRGKYLTAVGPNATLRSRNTCVSRDELFQLEESQLQAAFIAHNLKLVSTKTGLDVSANQDTDEVSDTEIFQIEQDKTSGKWLIRTSTDKYWTLETASGIQSKQLSASSRPSQLFELVWRPGGQVAFRAANGRYVSAKMNGHLHAASDLVSEKEEFEFHVMNRPILVLRGEHGYVGCKSQASAKLECNKSSYDTITVEQNSHGAYYFKDGQGRYWRVQDDGHIASDSIQATPFYLELRDQSKFAIKATNGHYIQGEQNGIFRAVADTITGATLWEF